MALSLSTTGNLQSMSKDVIASAVPNIEPAAPMRELVSQYTIAKGSYQTTVPLWNRMTALAVTEGVDLATPQTLAVAIKTLTASRHALLTFISDRLDHQNNENVLAEVGRQQGNAVGRLLDEDLLALLDGFSKSLAGAGVDLTFQDISGAIAYVRTTNATANGPAPSKPVAVLHPENIRRLVEATASLSSGNPSGVIPDGMSEDVAKQYWRGRDPLFGVPIIEDVNITRDGSGDTKGGVFCREALALAMEQEIKAADQRDESLFGTEVVMSGVWGETELVDSWGVELYSAADAAT